jgi:hypothetical protein
MVGAAAPNRLLYKTNLRILQTSNGGYQRLRHF